METTIDAYNLSPINQEILTQRLRQTDDLKKNIENTRQFFCEYIDLGKKMCASIFKLINCFDSSVGCDISLKSILKLLSGYTKAYVKHYNDIETLVISQIDKYLHNDIDTAIRNGKQATHETKTLSKLLDQYVSIPIKKRNQNGGAEFADKETKLIGQNWVAIRTNFKFARSLDLIERKRILELTSAFLTFANCLGTALTDGAKAYEQSVDDLNVLQQALPSSEIPLKEFAEHTSNLEQSLQTNFNMYFRSFNKNSVYQPSNETTNEGILWVKNQSGGLKKRWSKRYIFLSNGNVSIYKAKQAIQVDSFQLLVCTVKKFDDLERPFCFTIVSPNSKPIIFQALTEYERDKWMNIIQNNIEYLLSGNAAGSGPSDGQNNLALSKQQSLSNALITTSQQNLILTKISTNPANQICCDCQATQPSWVCINWGSVICIQCSGVHRSLTTSVSKVRSLTLDKIDDVTLRMFSVIGNSVVNSILEENLHLSNQYQQPAPGSLPNESNIQLAQYNNQQDISQSEASITLKRTEFTKEQRAEFIKDKYDLKRYVRMGQVCIEKALRENDYITVFRSICTGQIDRFPLALHMAAAIGDDLMCRLIALNIQDPNILDKGWTPLSYAVYHGNLAAAHVLLISGGNPDASDPAAHPYRIAVLKKDEEMIAMFTPYWDKNPITGQLEIPPHKIS